MKEPVFVTIEGYANCEIVPIDATHVGVDVDGAIAKARVLVDKALNNLEPPSYLPTREPLRPRIPDLCPDESMDKK